MNNARLPNLLHLHAAAIILAATSFHIALAAQVRLDPKTLDTYTGQYEAEAGRPFIVKRQGDGLTCRIAAEGIFKLDAKSEKDFQFKEVPGLGFTFVKDPKGKVTGLVFHKDGNNYSAPKVSDQTPGPRLPDLNKIPRRDPKATVNLLDLSSKYNGRLDDSWQPDTDNAVLQQNHLGAMPQGIQRFGSVEFDVRGVVQLNNPRFDALGGGMPDQVQGIRVARKCHRLHFLQGAQFQAADGTRIGTCVLRYTGGTQAQLPIVYGEHVRDWWYDGKGPLEAKSARIAWKGTNATAERNRAALRIFLSTRDNPHPDWTIESVDLVSDMADSAPFLIALTVE